MARVWHAVRNKNTGHSTSCSEHSTSRSNHNVKFERLNVTSKTGKKKRSKMHLRRTEMAELDRIEVLIELQGSRRQVSLKKESPEQLQAEFRHFDSSIELAVCSDRDSPGRKFLGSC